MRSLSACRIVTPFNTDQDIYNILLHAKGCDDQFTLRDAELQGNSAQRPDVLECIEMVEITSWHCLVRVWPVLAQPSTAIEDLIVLNAWKC